MTSAPRQRDRRQSFAMPPRSILTTGRQNGLDFGEDWMASWRELSAPLPACGERVRRREREKRPEASLAAAALVQPKRRTLPRAPVGSRTRLRAPDRSSRGPERARRRTRLSGLRRCHASWKLMRRCTVATPRTLPRPQLRRIKRLSATHLDERASSGRARRSANGCGCHRWPISVSRPR